MLVQHWILRYSYCLLSSRSLNVFPKTASRLYPKRRRIILRQALFTFSIRSHAPLLSAHPSARKPLRACHLPHDPEPITSRPLSSPRRPIPLPKPKRSEKLPPNPPTTQTHPTPLLPHPSPTPPHPSLLPAPLFITRPPKTKPPSSHHYHQPSPPPPSPTPTRTTSPISPPTPSASS